MFYDCNDTIFWRELSSNLKKNMVVRDSHFRQAPRSHDKIFTLFSNPYVNFNLPRELVGSSHEAFNSSLMIIFDTSEWTKSPSISKFSLIHSFKVLSIRPFELIERFSMRFRTSNSTVSLEQFLGRCYRKIGSRKRDRLWEILSWH